MAKVPIVRQAQKESQTTVEILPSSFDEIEIAYMARQLVQATLPHSNPGDVPIWKRTNGNMTLVIQPGFDEETEKSYGIPYGAIPRLLLFWLTTEALKTNSPKINLGRSLSDFMRQIGLDPSHGGIRGDARRMFEQANRLFSSKISFVHSSDHSNFGFKNRRHMLVAEEIETWWSKESPKQAALWESRIELGRRFFEAITAAPVPVSVEALRKLKRSPLALDLYSWLTYEAFRAQQRGESRLVKWGQLMQQLGADYDDTANFRRKVKAALVKVQKVYPELRLGDGQGGVEVLPSSQSAVIPTKALKSALRAS